MSGLPLFDAAWAERAKEQGIARSESGDPMLASMLRQEAKRIAQENGSVTIDDVRDWADSRGYVAPSPSFWGSIIRASHGFVILGYEKSRRKEKHAHLQPRWGLAA